MEEMCQVIQILLKRISLQYRQRYSKILDSFSYRNVN